MGGVVDAIGDVVGGAADVVGDVVGGVADVVGDVVETVTDNPALAIAGGIFLAPYLAPELFFSGAAGAGGLGAGLLAPEVAGIASSLGGLGTGAGLGLGAGLIAPEIAALGTYFGANTFPSLDFISSFIPKTPAEIAKTLGQAVLLGSATQIPQPQVPSVDMNIPGSNVPQYGTSRSIFNAYNTAKSNINNILYPQGLLATQPQSAGIYNQFLQEQGLL